jgi:tetratricopeptide (TPR) repeat protein
MDTMLVIIVSVAAGLTVLVRLFMFLRYRRQQAVLKAVYQELEKEPMNAQLWFNLGYVYIEIGKIDKALLCVERLLSIDAEKAKLLQGAIDHPELRSRGVADLHHSTVGISLIPAASAILSAPSAPSLTAGHIMLRSAFTMKLAM